MAIETTIIPQKITPADIVKHAIDINKEVHNYNIDLSQTIEFRPSSYDEQIVVTSETTIAEFTITNPVWIDHVDADFYTNTAGNYEYTFRFYQNNTLLKEETKTYNHTGSYSYTMTAAFYIQTDLTDPTATYKITVQSNSPNWKYHPRHIGAKSDDNLSFTTAKFNYLYYKPARAITKTAQFFNVYADETTTAKLYINGEQRNFNDALCSETPTEYTAVLKDGYVGTVVVEYF